MGLLFRLLGPPLRTDEAQNETIGSIAGVAVLGLDALASATYGPEAALTALLPLGKNAVHLIVGINCAVALVLLLVFFSYRQTLAAYPDGSGSYVVAKKNLGSFAGIVAACALGIDYILNAAVAISAGIGAAVSALPALLPFTLPLCLGVLTLLTLINLRGIRASGIAFLIPTYLFLACVVTTIAIGAYKTFHAGFAPQPIVPIAAVSPATASFSTWLLLKAFASGCAALTGVEAVSNAVPIFRKPSVKRARQTLTFIVVALAFLLLGISGLVRAYGITATPPGREGFQSVISQLASATLGRGFLYYLTLSATLLVLSLSANTSFAGFPRVCRMLALDGFLPEEFGRRGSRLVYSLGIIVLAILSGVLLCAFKGVTDKLIALFAVGAFLAFALTQIGMVVHWRNATPRRIGLAWINGVGAVATTCTLIILVVTKFSNGAWIILLALPLGVGVLCGIRHYQDKLRRAVEAEGPLQIEGGSDPMVLIPIKRLDRVARKALSLALGFSKEIQVVQIFSDDGDMETLAKEWSKLVEAPARRAGRPVPSLITLKSAYREFFEPLVHYTWDLARKQPERCIAVWIPELTERKWYTFILRHRATRLKRLLQLGGPPSIAIITTPWYLAELNRQPR